MTDELSQFSEDFGCHFSEYVSGSGNLHDLVITTIFFTAAICRLAAANMVGSGVVGSEVCADTPACTLYTVAQALLARCDLNLIGGAHAFREGARGPGKTRAEMAENQSALGFFLCRPPKPI